MYLKKILKPNKWVVIAGGVLCLAVLVGGYFYNLSHLARAVQIQTSQVSPPKVDKTSPGLPVRLRIPAIEVDALIETVGQTDTGLMDVPKSDNNVAWYQPGQRPGELGSAVIDGHYGIKNGQALVFQDLNKLQPGDKIYVLDDQGSTITFRVNRRQSFEAQADATTVFRSTDNLAHLNLITCEGDWNKQTKSFPQRLVIFADKE